MRPAHLRPASALQRWRSLALAASLGAALVANGSSRALANSDTSPLGSTVESMLEAAHALSPELRAAALDTSAAAARATSAAAFDDPTLKVMSDEVDRTSGPRINKTYFTVEQEFPLWGKRGLKRSAALAALDAARGEEQAATAELDERIKTGFARYYAASRALAVNADIRRVSRQMSKLATDRYGQGLGEQADALSAAADETRAAIETERLEAERREAAARLNAMLARPTSSALADPIVLRALPQSEPALETLVARAQTASPRLLAQGAMVEGAKAERELAERAWYPDVTLGAGAIQRDDGPAGYTASIALKIPLQWGAREADEKQATAKLGAAQQRLAARTASLEGDLGEALATLTAAQRMRDLTRDQLLPQLEAASQSAIANYGRRRGSFTMVLDAEHRLHETRLELLRIDIEAQTALAAIERLIGGTL